MKKICLLLSTAFLFEFAQAQVIKVDTVFSVSGIDTLSIQKIQPLDNGRFLLMYNDEKQLNSNNGFAPSKLISIDINGSLNSNIGLSTLDSVHSHSNVLLRALDGDFIVSTSVTGPDSVPRITKFNSVTGISSDFNGINLYTSKLQNPRISNIVALKDGSYLAAGFGSHSGKKEGFLCKISDSDTLYSKTYANPSSDYSIIQLTREKEKFAFMAAVSGPLSNLIVKKIDFDANLQWEANLGNLGNYISPESVISKLISTGDSGCVFAASGRMTSSSHLEDLIVKLDKHGNPEWLIQDTTSADKGFPIDIYATADGHFIILQNKQSKLSLLKLNLQGDTVNFITYNIKGQGDDFQSNVSIYNEHVASASTYDGRIGVVMLNNDANGVSTSFEYILLDSVFTMPPMPIDTVWPGDANADGEVNMYDVLPIGFGYGIVGAVRLNASNGFTPQLDTYWNDAIPNGLNVMYANCNGDMFIDDNDSTAILENYNQVHNKAEKQLELFATGSNVYLDAINDYAEPGDTIIIMLKVGDVNNTINNAYGMVVSVNYDPTKIDIISFNADNSFFKNSNDFLYLQKQLSGKIDLGMTRTDKVGVNGQGVIGSFKAILSTTISPNDSVLELKVGDVNIIDASYQSLQISSASDLQDTVIIKTVLTNVNKNVNSSKIFLYPNPSSDVLNIALSSDVSQQITSVIVYDAFGKEVMNQKTSNLKNIDISNLQNGIYQISLRGKEHQINKAFVVNKN